MGAIVSRKPAVYLAGAMTYTPDRGGGWREQVSPKLQALGFEVLDPRNLEMEGTSPAQIVQTDVGAIARSRYVLAYGGAPSWGTAMELWQAKQLSVPVITWLGVAADQIKLSAWLRFTSIAIHETLEQAVESIAFMEVRR